MTKKYTEELERGYSVSTVMEEAQRCLLCYDAPCSKACPAGTDPAKFIRSVRFRNFKGAAETIRINNVLGAVCARVCPTERYCESGCSRCGIDKPIDIGGIQRKIQILQEGELTDAVLTVSAADGTYAVTDPAGKVFERGGGVAIEEDGKKRPLTSSELQADLSDRVTTEVTDGHYYLLWRSQTFDLTKAFAGRDVVYLTLQDGTDTLYVTALSDGAVASSPNRYLLPGTDFDNNG